MPFLIDGHNLIPKIPGWSLADLDDEIQLVELLQKFHQQTGKRIEVFFDQAAPGQPHARTYGTIKAFFTPSGRTADQAIKNRLAQLGPGARNWTVISSDREVQVEARSAHARCVSSEEFARMLTTRTPGRSSPEKDEPAMSPQEVDDWLGLFAANEDEGPSDKG